jgi:WD40 repeat protein
VLLVAGCGAAFISCSQAPAPTTGGAGPRGSGPDPTPPTKWDHRKPPEPDQIRIDVAALNSDGSRALVAFWAHESSFLKGVSLLALYDTDGGRCLWTALPGRRVSSLRWLPGDRQVLVAQEGRPVSVWDATRGRVVRDLGSASRGFAIRDVSGDGRRALIGYEGRLRLVDVATGEELRGPYTALGYVRTGALSRDGSRLLTDRSQVRPMTLWDVRTGRAIRTYANELALLPGSEGLAPDGRRALVLVYEAERNPADHARLGLLDLDTSKVAWQNRWFVRTATFTPDSKNIAASVWRVGQHGFDDPYLVRWVAATGRELWRVGLGRLAVWAFSADGRRCLVSASPEGYWVLEDGAFPTLQLWDCTVGQRLQSWGTRAETEEAGEALRLRKYGPSTKKGGGR